MRSQKLDAFLAWLATRQHGVVTRRQLLQAGFSADVIQRRVASGALIPVHPGIYVVGHRAVSPLAYEAAAILACQPRALLNHLTAGRLWRLPIPDGGPIHVVVIGRSRRSLRGVQVHSIALDALDERMVEGVPLTAPALTILDLAGSLPEAGLVEALNEARVRRIVSDRELEGALERDPRRRGARALRALLTAEQGPALTRSAAERRALRAMHDHGLTPDASRSRSGGPERCDVAPAVGARHSPPPMSFCVLRVMAPTNAESQVCAARACGCARAREARA